MRDRIVKPERRQVERRAHRLSSLGDAVAEGPWGDRRVHCWDLDPDCSEEQRKKCAAYFVRRNCWDLWAAEYFPAGRRPCCHKDLDCSECSVASSKFGGPISVFVSTPTREEDEPHFGHEETASTFCRSLYNSRDAQAQRADSDGRNDFRCRHRPGIVLHESYVSEVCSCLDHRDCVFYEPE
jgi:hypothetical protein